MAASLPATYRALVTPAPGSPPTIVERKLELPGPGKVLVRVRACGVCLSDVVIANGRLGNIFPRVLGHELVGDVAAIGEGVTQWKVGDRVGGPWHGGHDHTCRACRRGQFQMCDNKRVNGVAHDGGYAEYTILRTEAVVRVPKDIDPAEVAPLLCAGVTVFNGIRRLGIHQGGLVAVQGLGGLGHLAVQYAHRMGYEVVAMSRGESKRSFAMELGASAYIDTEVEDPVAKLNEMGGAALIVCTAPNPAAFSPLTGALQAGGKILALASVDTTLHIAHLVARGASVHGWPSGHALDSEEAIAFAQDKGIKCLIERFRMEDVVEATERMTSGKVRFRSVLVMD